MICEHEPVRAKIGGSGVYCAKCGLWEDEWEAKIWCAWCNDYVKINNGSMIEHSWEDTHPYRPKNGGILGKLEIPPVVLWCKEGLK